MDELMITHLITGLSIVFAGVFSFLIKPKKSNNLMGYRTRRSIKSIEAWKFANDNFSRMMLWNSFAAITVQMFTYFTMESATSILVTVIVFTIGIGAGAILTESQLRQMFNPDGSAKRHISE